MTNLIAKVSELRELAIRAKKVERINEEKNTRSVDTEYAVKSYLASFDMLDVLSGFQAGDAEILETLIDYLESNHGGTEYEDAELPVMRRYANLARLMEDDHAT